MLSRCYISQFLKHAADSRLCMYVTLLAYHSDDIKLLTETVA